MDSCRRRRFRLHLTSLRAYQLFLGFVSILYAGISMLSLCGLLIGVVSASIVQNPDQQFRSHITIMFCSIATLPIACLVAIAGAWCLFFFRYYVLALLPLLLPFVSIALISFVAGKS